MTDSPRCNNCIDTVYMDDLGDGFYRCPVCGDETDTKYPQENPFGDDYASSPGGMFLCGTGLDEVLGTSERAINNDARDKAQAEKFRQYVADDPADRTIDLAVDNDYAQLAALRKLLDRDAE